MVEQHNEICLKGVNEILGMSFYIPKYQRGYRWGKQQVEDLLKDINEYDEKQSNFYCLQPLVVKNRNKETEEEILNKIREKKSLEEVKNLLKENWEVIDGQQRLTTLFIILKALDVDSPYKLEYETRKGSEKFLNELNENSLEDDDNIDYFHISHANKIIRYWINNNKIEKQEFKKKILDNVKFIWYESKEEDPIEVFTRLNIGKIGLTNAELIKALILNSSNFNESDKIVRQETIALEWDNIEYTFQNDEFWYFLNNVGNEKVTRIDFIFELIVEKDYLEVKNNRFDGNKDEYNKALGTDKYRTFRYFYEHFKRIDKDIAKKDLLKKEVWDKVKEIFRTFKEWFDDVEYYHYIGYLLDSTNNVVKINELLNAWNRKNKEDFKQTFLIGKIKDSIKECKDLDKQYEIKDESEESPQKTVCKPLLLLHNIQTIIDQNQNNIKEYEQHVFQKFPFHIFKKEKWDVEHIDSNTTNQLKSYQEMKDWLQYTTLYPEIKNKLESKDNNLESDTKEDKLKSNIIEFLEAKKEDSKKSDEEIKNLFDKIMVDVDKIVENADIDERRLDDKQKNQIGNFVLLDQSTNRGYGNAIFPVKRRCIIGKDKGKEISSDIKVIPKESKVKELEIKDTEELAKSSFIPPCTKYVFMKYYNPNSASIRVWDKNDAEAYKTNIQETLRIFLEDSKTNC